MEKHRANTFDILFKIFVWDRTSNWLKKQYFLVFRASVDLNKNVLSCLVQPNQGIRNQIFCRPMNVIYVNWNRISKGVFCKFQTSENSVCERNCSWTLKFYPIKILFYDMCALLIIPVSDQPCSKSFENIWTQWCLSHGAKKPLISTFSYWQVLNWKIKLLVFFFLSGLLYLILMEYE